MYDDPFHDVSDPLHDPMNVDAGGLGEDPGWDGGEDHEQDQHHGHEDDRDGGHGHGHDHDHDHEKPFQLGSHDDHCGSGDWDSPPLESPLHEDGLYTSVEEEDVDWPLQEGPQDCAFAAELGVLRTLGIDVSETEARQLALSEGWLTEHGTSPGDVGRLLEAYGVEVETGYGLTLPDLARARDEGRRILVGLDGEEIWHPVEGPGGSRLELPNHPHMVCFNRTATDAAGKTMVEVFDSASPDFRRWVNANDFLNAWADFGNFAVITRP